MVIKQFLTTIKYIFKRSPTIKYPYELRIIPERTRGRHWLVSDKCTGCSLCAMVCPAKAITMVSAPENMPLHKANAKRRIPHIDYSRCILCGMCVDVCNFDALFMSPDIFILGKNMDEIKINPEEYSIVSEKFNSTREEVLSTIRKKFRYLR